MASNNFDGRIVWPLSICMWVSTCFSLSTLSGSLLLDLLVSFIIQIYLYIVHTVYFGKFHWCYHDVWFPNGTANVNCILSTLCPQGKKWQSAVDGKLLIYHMVEDTQFQTCVHVVPHAHLTPEHWFNLQPLSRIYGKTHEKVMENRCPSWPPRCFRKNMLKIKSSTWRLLALYVKKKTASVTTTTQCYKYKCLT